MTALRANEVERFVERPNLEAGVILVYGPDSGLVREIAQRLVRRFAGGDSSSMNLVTLDGSEVDADPARLVIEARTGSLFGDRRVVRVRGAGKSAVMALTELLEDPSGAIVVVEGGDLKPRDALRALVEAGKAGRTLPCYPDTSATLEKLIVDWLGKAGIQADADVAPTLREILGNDREVTRRELEKLAFYAAESGTLTREDVLTLCADNGAMAIDAILDSTGTGHAEKLDTALDRALSAGLNLQQLLTMAIGHFTALRRWRVDVDAGRSARDVLASARPRPHFSRTALLEQQLRSWSDRALAAALERLQLAVAESRKRYSLQGTVVRRALLAVCRMAAEH